MTPERAEDIRAFSNLRDAYVQDGEARGGDEAHAAVKQQLAKMSPEDLVNLLAGAMNWVTNG